MIYLWSVGYSYGVELPSNSEGDARVENACEDASPTRCARRHAALRMEGSASRLEATQHHLPLL